MPRPEVVKRSDLEALINSGVTGRQEQADALTRTYQREVTLGMIDKARQKYRLTDKQPRYEWAIPWVVSAEDDKTTELQYLRELAAFADGTRNEFAIVNPAARWLKALFDAGLDIRYEKDNPKGERWVAFPANKSFTIIHGERKDNWHVRMLMQRVRDAATRQQPRGR